MKTKFDNSTIQQFNNRGFTIIELIVVFSVMAVLSTIGIASFSSFSKSQVLQQATNDLVNTLNTAKVRSASQNKPNPPCLANSILENYNVVINIALKTYSLNVVCSGTTNILKTTALPSNVNFNTASGTPPTTTTTIVFPVLTGGVNRSGNIVLSSFGLTKTITISQVGNISVQ